jgi:hypothetical protein
MNHETSTVLDWLSDVERSAVATLAEALSAAGVGSARLTVHSDAGMVQAGRSVRVDLSALRAQ